MLMFGLGFADSVVDTEQLTLIDRPVSLWVEGIRIPLLNRLMMLITTAGGWEVLAFGAILGGLLLWAAGWHRRLWWMGLSMTSGAAVVELTKLVTNRSRPPMVRALIEESGYSFPSGHSYFAVVFYGLITYFWAKHFSNKWHKTGIIILGTGLILVIAFSRIYLGVHYVSDVIGGLMISSAWLMVTVRFLEKYKYGTNGNKKFKKATIWKGFVVFTGLWLVAWMGTAWIKYLNPS